MKNILFLTATPTVGGNGDALISAAMEEAKKHGANVHLIHVREKRLWGYSSGRLWHCEEDRFVSVRNQHGTLSGLYAFGWL